MALTNIDQEKIDAMTHIDMARTIRFGSSMDWPWKDREIGEYFLQRFEALGGWSPELSKMIGWNK